MIAAVLLFAVLQFFAIASHGQTSQTSQNTANIALDPGSDLIDSNLANNQSTSEITVVAAPDVSYSKVADATSASVGDTIAYTVTVTVADAPLSADFLVTDTLGPGLAFSAVTIPGAFSCNNSNPLTCTLPSGTAPGSYSFTYTAVVTDSADSQVENSVTGSGGGDPTPTCDADCDIVIPVNPVITYHKVADVSEAPVGAPVTYTVTVDVANAPLAQDLLLSDALGTGLAFVDFVNPTAPFVCTAGATPQCTLSAGSGPGSFTFSYVAEITTAAGASVTNQVTASGGGNEPPVCDATCSVVVDVVRPSIIYNKVADTSGPVADGDSITYTVAVEIADAPLNDDLVLTDTLGTGLTFVSISNADAAFTCGTGNPFVCTLPAGTAPGTYSFDVTATVDATATGSVINSVTATGGGGNQPPQCDPDCDPQVPITDSYVTYTKTGTPSQAQIGDTVTYTISTTVSNSATTADITVVDSLGTGLAFGAITDAGIYDCPGGTFPCTLVSPVAPGTYELTFTATITADAGDSVRNTLLETGGGGAGPDCVGGCSVVTDILRPTVTYEKTASPAGPVVVGDIITYTIDVNVADARLTGDLQLTDTLGTGLSFIGFTGATAPFTCSSGNNFDCTLPAGAGPGTFTLIFTAEVTADAVGQVQNTVTASGIDDPTCSGNCAPVTPLVDSGITITKTSTPSPVEVRDIITYTVTVTIEDAPLTSDLTLVDSFGTGLTFVGIVGANTSPLYSCARGNPLTCSLPAGTPPGTYELTYTVIVNPAAGDTVENSVSGTGGGGTPPNCVDCSTVTPVIRPTVTYHKVPNVAQAEIGDVVTYTVFVTIEDADLDHELSLQDILGPGLQFQEFLQPTTPFSCTGTGPLTCTLPQDTPPGTYSFRYTAIVTPDAGTSVTNVVVASKDGGDPPECDRICEPTIPIVGPQINYHKTADADQTAVGDTITYTVTVDISGAALTEDLILDDTLGTGLAFNAVTEPTAPFTCTPGTPLQCILPAGTAAGSYSVSYTANVTDDAEQSVRNQVTASGGGGNPVCSGECAIIIPLAPQVTYHKTATPADVQVGGTITYTVAVTVSDADLSADITLTDTPSAGLVIETPTDAGSFTCSGNNPLSCVLPAGTAPGDYALTYTARVTEDAGDTVNNAVVASGGGAEPQCDGECSVTTPVNRPQVTYVKSASTNEVRPGDVVTYSVTVTVANASLSQPLVLTDTPGSGLQLIDVTAPGAFTCTDGTPLVCTLPAGTIPGSYSLQYTARVTDSASGSVDNAVVADGGGAQPTCAAQCEIRIPVLDPQITVSKSANPVSGTEVVVGQTIVYTLLVDIENSALSDDLVLVDMADSGLTITSTPPGCVQDGSEFECVLPAGTPAGEYELVYTAVVNNGAGAEVINRVVPSGGGDANPDCGRCETRHPVEAVNIRLQKSASVREVQTGDIVFYRLTAENIGSRDLINGVIVDTPPAGFTYVENSLLVDDVDQSGTLLNTNPLTVGDIDIPVGDTATISYAMRVGAGVRPGSHVNEAQVQDADGEPVSNVASAEVVLAVDPLTQESLVIGTVFDDRNGNSIQDSATLSGVRVRGGFNPAFYVAGSTTVNGVPVADASAPLLRGLDLGELRGSGSGSVDGERIVIRQKLTSPIFTDDFHLTSSQGYTLRMDAAGALKSRRGNSAADIIIERRIEATDSGVFVEFILANRGVDERGIPGVRIASVDGLLVETDRYGRYHLVGIDGGHWERGRNFILKLDTATLPQGTRFTTRNPLVRRITPGVPVRFDFGVQLPAMIVEEPTRAPVERNGGVE